MELRQNKEGIKQIGTFELLKNRRKRQKRRVLYRARYGADPSVPECRNRWCHQGCSRCVDLKELAVRLSCQTRIICTCARVIRS